MPQMEVSSLKGCVSVSQEGNSYTQNSELRWNHKSIKQGLKYQRAEQEMHNLQFSVGLEKVSPAPCPSHSLLVKIQTNLRDRLEHAALLGICPPHPALLWSGSHRMNSGEEVFYSQTRLSTPGRPRLSSFILVLTDSATPRGSNVSLFSESRMGNWSVEVGASAVSWPRGSGLLLHASLDHRERIWMNGTLEGRCLRSTAGYGNGPGLDDDLTVVACTAANGSVTLEVQERVGGGLPKAVGGLSLGSADQRLTLRAKACLDGLAAIEARIHQFSSQVGNKLLHRLRTLQDVLLELRQQPLDSRLLEALTSAPLRVAQRLEGFLGRRGGRPGPALAERSPASPQPLATLAGVYQDVRGQKPEELWRDAVSMWTRWLLEVIPDLLGNAQLRPLARASISAFGGALDATGQRTYQWLENRLALALSGVRKRLASVYKLSPRFWPAIKLSPPSVKSNKKFREGATVRFDTFPTDLRDFYGNSVVQTSR
ncbi:hypothetical protein fugu_014195 [Takifugu bimaculatus]|uniref:Uncharacterized protein n=1 Tax=Takifugu bimaculatus TaxID=433685 RepID=A0A4Z2C0J7_9TELE|nr:hypothetical protein fugu_014195 [Takifugu bimaculatus]